MKTKHQIISEFLKKQGINCYHKGLEVQVIVDQGIGEKTNKGFTDGRNTWYNFRLNNEKYLGTTLGYNFKAHVKAIGFTGWNFLTKQSEWVGFDFDSNIGHEKGLPDQDLNNIIVRAKTVPWVTIKRSTSGKGLHIYVPLSPNGPEIKSRAEHIQLSKSILSTLSSLLGFDFKTKVDCCGTVLWVWHKNQSSNAYQYYHKATSVLVNYPKITKEQSTKKLAAATRFTGLDIEHDRLVQYVIGKEQVGWWDAEKNMLVTHTAILAKAYKELSLKGLFFTISTGKDLPDDYNCFCFPLENGQWIIRRYGNDCKEHQYWKVDKNGWTYCYYNKIPTLSDICPIFDGKQNSKGEWVFNDSKQCNEILRHISPTKHVSIPIWAEHRQLLIRPLKDSKIAIQFEREKQDPPNKEWLKRRNCWEKVIVIYEQEKNIRPPDELVRHVVSGGESMGWFIKSERGWNREQKNDIKDALLSLGYAPKVVGDLIGQCIFNPWSLVNDPFNEEYPGDRKWNKFACQLATKPKEGEFPTWRKLIYHIGKNLGPALAENSWAMAYNIVEGGDYLLLWFASVFQYPKQSLPYLFFYGSQATGKSTLHEALRLLVKDGKGIERAENALTNTQGFNKELAGCVVALIDEFNLSSNKKAYDRLKDWVTAKFITIHPKFGDLFELENTTHWIQTANNPSFCPIQFGDTRIITMLVDPLVKQIPKDQFFTKLKEETPAFLHHITTMEIPPAIDRLRIPVIITGEKQEQQQAAANPVETFILEEMVSCPGNAILYSKFCNRFRSWVDSQGGESIYWTSRKIGASISINANMPVRGRMGGRGDIYIGNFCFRDEEVEPKPLLIKVGDRLRSKIKEKKDEEG